MYVICSLFMCCCFSFSEYNGTTNTSEGHSVVHSLWFYGKCFLVFQVLCDFINSTVLLQLPACTESYAELYCCLIASRQQSVFEFSIFTLMRGHVVAQVSV